MCSATPIFRVPNYQGLSADVSYVAALAMVCSQYWKRLEVKFRNKIISAISQNEENYKNIFSPVFFNIAKEPLLVQKQTLHQKKSPWSQLKFAILKVGRALSGGRQASSLRKAFLLIFYRRVEGFDTLPSMTWSRPSDNALPIFRVSN